MKFMLKLLAEKDKTCIGEDIINYLSSSLKNMSVVRHENSNYIVLFISPIKTIKYFNNKRKNMLRVVKTVVKSIVEYILTAMPDKYIMQVINERYTDLKYSDKTSVCKTISDCVAHDIKSDIRVHKKRNWYTVMYERVLINMLESGMFAVNSFIRFRINDFAEYVNKAANVSLERISGEIRYMDFIGGLQKLVDERHPKLFELKINVDKKGYTLTDGNDDPIDISIYETAKKDGIDKEDLLIGILLVAAPVRILVSAEDSFFNTNLFSTISNIFGDRIIVDYARIGN